MKTSTNLQIAFSLAAHEAQRRRHELMTIEHLLFALAHDADTARVIRNSGGNVERLKVILDKALSEDQSALPGNAPVSPEPSRGFQRVLQRALWHVESSGKDELKGENVLVAMFSEADSAAVQALHDVGTSRLDVVSYISHGTAKERDEDGDSEPRALAETTEKEPEEPDALERFAVALNERAKKGELEPLVGRENEIRRAIQVLARRRKNNPLLV
ncbi:MAG TPA: Clp protease N-terminal domain-containing protein, partial [Polyangiaceae bacterium]|nr:Clp protease N-terminal domain-containing protein [Polyangiaceae bacterium]